MACCVLHNIALERRQPLTRETEFVEFVLAPPVIEVQPPPPTNREQLHIRRLGAARRAQLIATLY